MQSEFFYLVAWDELWYHAHVHEGAEYVSVCVIWSSLVPTFTPHSARQIWWL